MAALAKEGKLPTEKQARDLDYETPRRVLDRVDLYYGGSIPFDPATTEKNPTNAESFCHLGLGGCDGLLADWRDGVWINPPYGKPMRLWLERIGREARDGMEIIALLPANRSETSYWQSDVAGVARSVCFVRKRISFLRPSTGEPAKGNPYASVIWGFNTQDQKFGEAFSPLGLVLHLKVHA